MTAQREGDPLSIMPAYRGWAVPVLAQSAVAAGLAWIAPILVASLTLFSFLGTRSELDGHEVLVAQTAREMIQSGDWIHPTFGGEPRHQKPPLAYWLAARSYQCLGEVSPFAARLPSALSAVALVTLVMIAGQRWFGRDVALVAGIVQATSWWTIAYGKSALVDMMLTTLVASAIICLPLSSEPPETTGRWHLLRNAGFWLLCGLSFIAKGPVGPLIILLTTGLHSLFHRPRHFRSGGAWRTHIALALIFLGTAVAWPLAVWWATPEAAGLWTEQSIGRFLIHWGPQTRPIWYFLYKVPLLMLPWSLVAVAAGYWSLRKRASGSEKRDARAREAVHLLCAWFLTSLVIFSFSEGKREHYILPGLPPLSLLTALVLNRWFVLGSSGTRLRPRIIIATLVMSMVVGILVWDGYVAPNSDRRTVWNRMLCHHPEVLRSTPILVQYGANDHSTIFPIDRPMQWVTSPAELSAFIQAHEPLVVVTPASHVEELARHYEARLIDRSGFAPLELRPVGDNELVIVELRGQ